MLRLILVALALWAGAARAEDCREALALGLDVSGSVDDAEYRLQLSGLATALDNPQVRAALLTRDQPPVQLMVYEWSGPEDQRVLVPWVRIADAATLDRVRARLSGVARIHMEPSTAIGSAMRFGAVALAQQSECWRQVLDVSGDGRHNTGPHPQAIDMGHVTVNGLVIGEAQGGGQATGIAQLSAYFRAYVLRGPDAFVEAAAGFRDFEAAMVRKLLRELEILPVARAVPPGDAPKRSWEGRHGGPQISPKISPRVLQGALPTPQGGGTQDGGVQGTAIKVSLRRDMSGAP